MTCADVERVLPEFLDGNSDDQDAFDIHLKSCPACSDLVSDLKLIIRKARDMPDTEEPAPRVWVRIAAQLRAEGLVVDTPAGDRPVNRVPSSAGRRWMSTGWWLAPIAAGLLAAGSYIVSHKPAPQVAKQALAPPQAAPIVENSAANTADSLKTPVSAPPAPASVQQRAAEPTVAAKSSEKPALEAEGSAEDQQFLSVVSTGAPAQRAAYESQLQAVNANIREVQSYLAQNPGDADARQQLMDAYQQKALLYQIAMDRIQ
jgi:hypothetical protein